MGRFLVALLVAVLGLGLAGCDGGVEQKAGTKAKSTATAPKSDLIDINRASAEELMALKGIGEARAKAIIEGRPYARKDEIVQRKLVPQSVYDDIKHLIIARQK